ncbi:MULTISPECIES: STAS domain-containing protein [Streptomyces]|uniref:STAS domain-containing protein n=1 Tax=Streptomyces sp. H-KF8 TaxID=1727216 RepID=UPI003B634EB9
MRERPSRPGPRRAPVGRRPAHRETGPRRRPGDHDTCDGLLRRARSALDGREDVGDLRLDCRELGNVDSMGLSTLPQIHRSAGHDGIGFHLDEVGPALRRLLEVTGTCTYLTTPGRAGPSAESRRHPS